MKTNKGITTLGVVLIVLGVLVLIGIGYYLKLKNRNTGPDTILPSKDVSENTTNGNKIIITTPSTLPNAIVGNNYSFSPVTSGGCRGSVWIITAGSLPPGLSLKEGMEIGGIPTTAGTYSFALTVDSKTITGDDRTAVKAGTVECSSFATKNFSLKVSSGAGQTQQNDPELNSVFSFTLPKVGSQLSLGSTYPVILNKELLSKYNPLIHSYSLIDSLGKPAGAICPGSDYFVGEGKSAFMWKAGEIYSNCAGTGNIQMARPSSGKYQILFTELDANGNKIRATKSGWFDLYGPNL